MARIRVALTGGPGGGKTTAADLFRREIGDSIVIVPESATMLFTGGFPRTDNAEARRSIQRAIFHVQRNLEDGYRALYPDRTLLCDRGTLDGAVYWPETPNAFFAAVDSGLTQELDRYDAVLFFESAAVGGICIEGGNPTRTETVREAAALDARLRELWSAHPHFVLVRHEASFFSKLESGLSALRDVLGTRGHAT